MNFETIRAKINNKEYRTALEYPMVPRLPEDYIFDEDKSVKYNRTEVAKHNDAIEAARKAYGVDESAKYNDFVDDVMEMLMQDKKFTEAQARAIYSKAYSDGHSSGVSEILGCVADYMDFAETILKG